MKYFSLDTVSTAYFANSRTTSNKFWGLLGILSAVDSTVAPAISYDFKSDQVSNLLDSLFILKEGKSTASRGQSRSIMLSKEWTSYVSDFLTPHTPNIYSVLVWYFRLSSFEDNISDAELVAKFLESTHISNEDAAKIFSFDKIDIVFSETKCNESSLKTALNKTGDNITAENNTVVAAPGDFTRGPFLQPLYASQDIMKCLILSTFNLNQYYMDESSAITNDIRECVYGPTECGIGKPGMPAFLEGVIVTTKDYEENLDSLSDNFKVTENRLYVDECCLGIDPEQAILQMSKPKHEKDANLDISWEFDGRQFCLYRELRKESFRSFIDAYNRAYSGIFEIDIETNAAGVLTYRLYRIRNSKIETVQKIYFGTPGAGKSHSVDKYVKEHRGIVFRTTFHPDSDYATFVGAYKPKKGDSGIDYKFVPQAFTNAYVASWKNPTKPVYLIIEEINRGNCAQIFGDLFQLLDRRKGWSEYSISVDTDLAEYLTAALSELEEGEVDGSAGIENGRIKLRPNLSIIATMNTSDQSLFPMDSAFKRRWDWEYVPIDADCADSQFKITIADKTYKWPSFLIEVNKRIHKLSDSEDKQMGNFFIKNDVDVDEFKSKVMFYLWSEVCKEYENSGSFFKDKRNGDAEFTFNSLFPTNAETNSRLQGFMEFLGIEEA